MNNEFAVISFKEKRRKRSVQTWESKQCDSIRNHVERIHFFKNKIKEQLKILILFHRCLIKKHERSPQPVQIHCHIQSMIQLDKGSTYTQAAFFFSHCLPSIGSSRLEMLRQLSTTPKDTARAPTAARFCPEYWDTPGHFLTTFSRC